MRSESNHEKRAALICLLTAALAANGTAATTPYVNRLLLKNGKYIDAPSIAPGKGKKSSSGTTVVDNEADADAALIYFCPDGDTDRTTNPKAFDQGWRDGWKLASKQSTFSSDEPAEKMEAKLYGDLDNDSGETKAIGFFSAFSVLRHRAENGQKAAACRTSTGV